MSKIEGLRNIARSRAGLGIAAGLAVLSLGGAVCNPVNDAYNKGRADAAATQQVGARALGAEATPGTGSAAAGPRPVDASPVISTTAKVDATARAAQTTVVVARPNTSADSSRIQPAENLEHDFELKPGEKIKLEDSDFQGGFVVVKGDVTINGINTFDNNPKTGDMTIITEPAVVAAKWGANFTVKLNKANLATFVQHNTGLMKDKGCEGGCEEVRLFMFDGKTLKPATVDVLVGKTNGVPAPAQVPAKTAEAGKITTSGENFPACVDHELGKGEIFTAPDTGYVSGDVKVEGKRLFDDDPKTALVVELDKPGAVIEAPYGADFHCVSGADQQTMASVVGKIVEETNATGKFNSVTVAKWPIQQ